MGNIISQKESPKDQLIRLETEVTRTEYELNELQASNSVSSTLWMGVFLVPSMAYFSYIFEVPYAFSFLFISLFLSSWYLLYGFVLDRRRRNKKIKLDLLREKRRGVIERCKNDVNFSITKNLIEKYEDEEARNTFFNQISKVKRSPLDTVSDFVLGSDPSKMNALICTKCGVHNGLVDPKNDSFGFYYCYSCRHKNLRKDPGKEKTTSPRLQNSTSLSS